MKKLIRYLSSYILSVYIFLIAGFYYIFLLAWSYTTPKEVLRSIAVTLPFLLLYILFFINITLCIYNRLKLIKRVTSSNLFLHKRAALDKGFKIQINSEKTDRFLELLKRYFRNRGYKKYQDDKDGIVFLKGKHSMFGEVLFHLFPLFIVSGVLLSIFFRFEGRFNLVDGFDFQGRYTEYFEKPSVERFERRAPQLTFKLLETQAEFWKDKLLFTDMYSRIEREVDGDLSSHIVRLKGGIWYGITHLNIEGFGYAPVYDLFSPDGSRIDTVIVNANVFPAGTQDSFEVLDTPYTVILKVYPDAVFMDGKINQISFGIGEPLFDTKIIRGRRLVFNGIVKLGERIKLEDNFILQFAELKKWGQFRIVKDYGIPFIWAGMIIGIGGLFWRFFLYRREIYVKIEDNIIGLSAESEWFKEIFKKEIHRAIAKIIKIIKN